MSSKNVAWESRTSEEKILPGRWSTVLQEYQLPWKSNSGRREAWTWDGCVWCIQIKAKVILSQPPHLESILYSKLVIFLKRNSLKTPWQLLLAWCKMHSIVWPLLMPLALTLSPNQPFVAATVFPPLSLANSTLASGLSLRVPPLRSLSQLPRWFRCFSTVSLSILQHTSDCI